MIISYNWLKKYTDINLPIDELSKLIGARLVEIEETVDLGKKYQNALMVDVISATKIEGSDHLNLVTIDDKRAVAEVDRNDNGSVQVVCGAPNIAAGQKVVWLPPSSVVPVTYGKADEMKLDIRKLRGFTSNGMIASAKELDLSEDHDGILVINDDVEAGTKLSDYLELNDYLIDIENKSLTHRPDCFGVVGFAREVAAISGEPFHAPEWLTDMSRLPLTTDNPLNLTVKIDDESLSDRYMAVVMSGADGSKKSPLWVQTYLSRIGIRSINAVVDVTNYLMVLTGQPLHAFDYDKLVKVADGRAEIHVRSGRPNEKLTLLDGRTIELCPADIVIAAGEKAVALAGAMGGYDTEIDDSTKNILIESATFSLYNLRATQMRHGIFSEAITRFTKGQPAELAMPVIKEAIRLMSEWSGAMAVSDIVEDYPTKTEPNPIHITTEFVNNVLGSNFTKDQIIKTLRNVEFTVNDFESDITIKRPYWRHDINIAEDVVEEIGRINGFDNINPTLPIRDFSAQSIGQFDIFRSKVSDLLVRSGANEILSYSFVHGDLLNKVGQDYRNSYRIVNSISPSLQYYRQSLTPSLLDLVNANIRQGYDEFALAEINKVHQKSSGMTDEGVPIEDNMLAMVYASKTARNGAAYYRAKKQFDFLRQHIGLEVEYKAMAERSDGRPYSKPFETKRSAYIIDKRSGKEIGVIGEYKQSVKKGLKLPDYSAGFEIDMIQVFESVKDYVGDYQPLGRYPGTERDICFQVSSDLEYGRIESQVQSALKELDYQSRLSPIDIYQADGSKTKNITVRISLKSTDHTLTGEEVTMALDKITSIVVTNVEASVI
ncbi:phenylalanine--tRNA ligase subunit beta [Candidatus Saccharibacteria bacterium]|nr:phenylalanine--tRNA ligase subunit beta [Candidatus Saccharibacteria bacterium]